MSVKVLEFENDDCANVNGTHYISTITTTYDQLVEIFGKPTFTDADPYEKVNAEWTIEAKVIEDDAEDEDDWFYKNFTIYNWKTGYIPTGEYEWHVGGHDYEAHEIASTIYENHINNSKGQDVMVTTTVATTVTMIATIIAFYWGKHLGNKASVTKIVDSMLDKMEKDGFIKTKKNCLGQTELIPIKDLTNGQ